MKLLGEYVDFGEIQGGGTAAGVPPAQNGQAAAEPVTRGDADGGSPTEQLKRGMQMSEVNHLLGEGKQLSESTAPEGVKTQVVEYLSGDRRVEVTYAEGLVVRFSISSR
jgi:hypothetical protein